MHVGKSLAPRRGSCHLPRVRRDTTYPDDNVQVEGARVRYFGTGGEFVFTMQGALYVQHRRQTASVRKLSRQRSAGRGGRGGAEGCTRSRMKFRELFTAGAGHSYEKERVN